ASDGRGVRTTSGPVQRSAWETGVEMAKKGDRKAVQHRRRQLPARVAATPEVVAVEVDGGRLRTREVGCGPGVHEYQNKEDKIACLVTLHSAVQETDPQPEPPPSFREPRRVQRLGRRRPGRSGDKPQEEAGQEARATAARPEATLSQRPHWEVGREWTIEG